MPYKDPAKHKAAALERSRRYRAKKHAEKFGPAAGDMRGRHGNHARGDRNAKWRGGRFMTSHGYVAVRVAPDHLHAWGHHANVKYAYEHILVMESHLGRHLKPKEIVHHKNENKADNRIENLELMTSSAHMKEHAASRGRDTLGRFPPTDLRVREFPR